MLKSSRSLISIFLILASFELSNVAYAVYSISTSSDESKKHGLYIGQVTVEPTYFDWLNHKVEVYDSWLERYWQGDVCLCFKLKVDGGLLEEHRIAHKEGDFIKFKQEPEGDPITRPDYISFVPKRRLVKYYMGGTYGEFVHYQRLSEPWPESVRLRVGKRNDGLKTKQVFSAPQFSDTLLNFQLPKPNHAKL